jgi:hypothetical protein
MKGQDEHLQFDIMALCDKHATGVQAIVSEHSRAVDEALTDCMARLAKIEDDVDAEMMVAADEYRTAKRDNERPDAGHPQWEHQKRINTLVMDAREAAQAERDVYMDRCKAAQNRLDELNNAARVDLLKNTQALFQTLDIDSLDAATIAQTAQAIWSGWSTQRCA